MASKQVNKSLAEKPHGYEFLGPYDILTTHQYHLRS